MKITLNQLFEKKQNQQKLVCLTAYTTSMASLCDAVCDLVLVGDSVGMVLYGMDNTLSVTMDMMIAHGKAVQRGIKRAFWVVDMPFGSYQQSPEQAFENAAKLMAETGCDAIKLEGGQIMAPTIQFLVQRGIPVLAHIGLQPQSVQVSGGYKIRGKTEMDVEQLIQDAKAIEDAGSFAVVIEGCTAKAASILTKTLSIPTIGIGASNDCDGQILVTEDLLGATQGRIPKFVKQYASLNHIIQEALENFAEDVRTGKFPNQDHLY
jgi:3-methyl-2-oxobutanoate hydroxymethyltransferase